MKKLLLLFVLLPMVTSTSAVEINGIYYEVISKAKEAKVCGAKDENTIVIPETVEYEGITYRVTSIKEGAFARKNLVSITIPKSVTNIGHDAFSYCDNLKSVHITDLEAWCKISFDFDYQYIIDVEDFGRRYDYYYVSNPLFYAHHLFLKGTEIKDLVIPNSVTDIGSYTFQGCTDLISVTIPNGVTSIGAGAFSGCVGLPSVTIPSSVSSIGNDSFSGCYGLTSVTIPNSVTNLGQGTFSGCYRLTSVTIPNSVTSIGKEAFRNCSGLTSIEIPNSVTSIGQSAFSGCNGLTSIEIPNSVTSIGQSAFSGCNGLTSIEIPNSVTSIGGSAFSYCSGLTSVHISDLEAWCKISFSSSSNPLSFAGHLFLNGAEITDLVIPNSVTSIGGYAFSGCSGLTSITIPNSVTSIGEYAFSGCSGLTSVTIPNSVTSIGGSAFSGCSGLTSVTIPNSVTSIGEYAFSGCSGLTSVTIPSSVTSIGASAFSHCSGLTSVTIPNSVTSIGGGAFSGCSNLSAVEINCQDVYAWFSGMISIKELKLGRGVKKIGSRAFAKCKELTDVYCYAEAVPSTNSDAFDDSYIEYSTLHVPAESIDAYKSKAPWSSFKTIIGITGTESSTYNLIYMVDGIVYWTYKIEAGASIAPEPTPTKEGYTFSGWSEIPETMPAHDVTITGVFTKNPPMEKCATPTIAYVGGKLVFDCETEDVEFVYSFSFASTSTSAYQLVGNNVNLPTKYKVTVYAKKDGYENSEMVTKEIDVRGLMGDMNEDGNLSVTDVTILIDKILKQQ
jgi:hypothetical protein